MLRRSSFFLNRSVSFLGSGRMAQALAAGLADAEEFSSILMCDVRQSALDAVKVHPQTNDKFKYSLRVKDALDTDVIFLSVHPQESVKLLGNLGPLLDKQHLLISIMAGTSISKIRESMMRNTKPRVVRCMPNVALQIGKGATVFCTDNASKEDCDLCRDIFSRLGFCLQLPEEQIDVSTGVSGSSPALVAEFIDSLATGGVKHGISRKEAVMLAANAVYGAAAMVAREGSCEGLRDAVCTPGGCSIAGVVQLERDGFKKAVINAVDTIISTTKSFSDKKS